MKKLLFFFLILHPFNGFAQITTGTIQIKVIDMDSLEFDSAKVDIFLKNEVFISGRTDSAGIYKISNLKPERYLIRVSAKNHYIQEITTNVFSSFQSELEIKLNPLSLLPCTISDYWPESMIKDWYGGSTTYKTDQILKMPVR
jgi:hypothetical protein